MSKYPLSVVGPADMPTRLDGAVIYGEHMNLVQNEIMAIESILGVGRSVTVGVNSLVDGGFSTLVERLSNMSEGLREADAHRTSPQGVHGVTGKVVGDTDVQTLTNKTLVDPVIQGTVQSGGTQWVGDITFKDTVTFLGKVILGLSPEIKDFTNAQHDHSSPAQGGNIPTSSVAGLNAALAGKANAQHQHVKSDITDFQHTIDSHTGQLPASRVDGLGTASRMDVPVGAGTAAGSTQVVRGDDPRLSDGRAPKSHASTHASNGTDPITPASIGAATQAHTHTKSQITDFSHPLDSAQHTGSLPQSRVTNLTSSLNGKLGVNGKAYDSYRVNGKRITVSSSAPSSPSINDVWIQV